MANDKKKTDIAKGVVSKSRFCMRVCDSGKRKVGNVGDSSSGRGAHDTRSRQGEGQRYLIARLC